MAGPDRVELAHRASRLVARALGLLDRRLPPERRADARAALRDARALLAAHPSIAAGLARRFEGELVALLDRAARAA